MAFNPNFNPNCGACGGLNSRGYCNYTACRFPVIKQTAVPKPVTNYDRIVRKTPEELAVQLALPYLASPPWCSEHITCPYISEDQTPCDKCALEWLKQEATDD